jgi:two-component sensor histidine kinase
MVAVWREELADPGDVAMVTRIAEVARFCRSNWDRLDQTLEAVLDAAIELTNADKGNIQLLDESGALVLTTQRGFEDEFLRFFARVHDRSSVCGLALCAGEQIVEADVETSDVFVGTDGLPVMRRAGVRAVQSTPLVSGAGKVLGMISTHFAYPHRPTQTELAGVSLLAGIGADHLEFVEARRSARSSAEILETLLELLPIPAAIATDSECRNVRSNSATAKLYGVAEIDNLSQVAAEFGKGALITHYLDGRRLRPQELPMQVAAATGVAVRDVVIGFEVEGGQSGAISVSAAPLFDSEGAVIGAVGTFADITALQKAQDAQTILTRELQHRGNNLLGIVQAIAHRSFAGVASVEEAKSKLDLRLQAMSRANDLLVKATDEGRVDLREAITVALEPFDARFETDGANVWLNSTHIQNLSLALHELGTNAIKYGALSNDEGSVIIAWRVEGDGDEPAVVLTWRERGGPPIGRPSREGMGTRMLRSLFNSVVIDFAPEGLRCELRVPLA